MKVGGKAHAGTTRVCSYTKWKEEELTLAISQSAATVEDEAKWFKGNTYIILWV